MIAIALALFLVGLVLLAGLSLLAAWGVVSLSPGLPFWPVAAIIFVVSVLLASV